MLSDFRGTALTPDFLPHKLPTPRAGLLVPQDARRLRRRGALPLQLQTPASHPLGVRVSGSQDSWSHKNPVFQGNL